MNMDELLQINENTGIRELRKNRSSLCYIAILSFVIIVYMSMQLQQLR